MNIRKLEDLTKEELIELVKHERGDHNEDALADGKTSDSVLNAKYTDGYISGYVVACNFAASLAAEAWVNHVFHTGLDGLIERCKNMEQVLLEKAQACHGSGSRLRTFLPVGINPETEDIDPLAMIPKGWKLVPVEPTYDMTQAGVNLALSARISGAYPWPTYIRDMYKAMLAAAPQPVQFAQERKKAPDEQAHQLIEALVRCRHQASYLIGDSEALRNQLSKVRDIVNETVAELKGWPQPDHIPDAGKMIDPVVKESLTVEPTDTEMLNWLIEKEALICHSVTANLYEIWLDIDNVETGKTAREAITKAMRGEE